MGWLIDVAAGVLRGSGHKDLGEWLENAPAKLGEEIGVILQAGLKSRGELAEDAVAKLEELRKTTPALPRPMANDLLHEYLADLNMLANLAAPLKAIAIRGFFHDRDCVTLWIFDDPLMPGFEIEEPKDRARRIKVSGSGARILLLGSMNDDELRRLNLEIERDIDSLLKTITDPYHVDYLTTNDVVLHIEPTLSSILSDLKNKSVPISAPENIEEAFRTLPIALQTQADRLEQYRQAAKNWQART